MDHRGQGMVCVLVCGIQAGKLGKRRYVEGSRAGGWGSKDWKCPRGGSCVVVTRGDELERHRWCSGNGVLGISEVVRRWRMGPRSGQPCGVGEDAVGMDDKADSEPWVWGVAQRHGEQRR